MRLLFWLLRLLFGQSKRTLWDQPSIHVTIPPSRRPPD